MKHIHTFDEFLIEGKLELNKTIPTSTKQYTWIYQTEKDSSKTAVEINKKLNGIGIASFISKTTGDTIAIPTGDLEKAFDEVISAYDNMKQFAYTDGTKINKKIVNEQTFAFESFLNERYSAADKRAINDMVVKSIVSTALSGLNPKSQIVNAKVIDDITIEITTEFETAQYKLTKITT